MSAQGGATERRATLGNQLLKSKPQGGGPKREHHSMSFQDEFSELCKRHGLEIDERYVWDDLRLIDCL